MFLFQHPEEYLRSLEAERDRIERRTRLLRDLRGATPPFDEAQSRRLTAAFADLTSSTQMPDRDGRRAHLPCPEMRESMTP
jgi:hypothetical protein